MKIFNILFLITAFIITSCSNSTEKASPSQSDEQYVVMLSLDGFRWDYAERVETPNLDKIAEIGVKADALMSSFPTKTFPNHYTIATGLYPANHGIVNNTFYLPNRDEMYQIRDRKMVEDGSIYAGEPIWVTAEKQGVKTASFFWVGSEADVQGIQPSIWKSYDGSVTYTNRIDSVISWLKLDSEKRPRLISWYIDEPDHLGHVYGPNSEKIDSMVIELDKLIGIYMQKISELEIASKINIIILSDHGMSEISGDRAYSLQELIPDEIKYEAYGGNPIYSIWADSFEVEKIHKIITETPNLKSFKADSIWEKWHYKNNDRIGDLIVVADSSYSIFRKKIRIRNEVEGTHGYDNFNKDMDAIFYAYGPAFKENYKMKKFQNIHIYPLIAEILKIQAAKVDGDIEIVREMLRE
jgi:alkaline phosphatase D